MPTEIDTILSEEGIIEIDEPIKRMSRVRIKELFSFQSSGKINRTRLIKNIVWQAYSWIRDGKREPLDTNIRGFWYSDIKPVLSRCRLKTTDRELEIMYDVFVDLIENHRLFRYRDMGFIDENWENHRIGTANPRVILFVEKEGLYKWVKDIAKRFDCTAYSLGGFPSVLSTEYFVAALCRRTNLDHTFHLFSVVDYDPRGHEIEKAFIEQLKAQDMINIELHHLVKPALLPPEEIEIAKYRLKHDTMTANWLQRTGGINGEPYGLEANAFSSLLIKESFLSEAPSLNGPQPVTEQPLANFITDLMNLIGRYDISPPPR